MARKPRRDHVLSLRASDAEKQRLETLAAERGVSLSDLLRDLVRYVQADAPVPHAVPLEPPSVTLGSPATITWFAVPAA